MMINQREREAVRLRTRPELRGFSPINWEIVTVYNSSYMENVKNISNDNFIWDVYQILRHIIPKISLKKENKGDNAGI